MSEPLSSSDAALPVASAAMVRRVAAELVRQVRRATIGATALTIAAMAAGLVGPWAVGRVVDTATGHSHGNLITTLGWLMVAALVTEAALRAVGTAVSMRAGQVVLAKLRERFVEAMLRLPLGRVEQAGTGQLISRTSDDVDAVSAVVSRGIPEVAPTAVMIIATVVGSFLLDPLVSLGMLLGLGIVPVIRWYLRRSAPMWHEVGRGFSAVSDAISSNAEAAEDIDLLSLGPSRRRAVDGALGRLYRARRREIRLSASTLVPAINLMITIPQFAALLWGGFLAFHGATTAGAVAAVCLYIGRLERPSMQLLTWVNQFQRAGVSAARILGIEELAQPDAGPIRPIGSTVELDGVGFCYQVGRPVLRDICLQVPPGEQLVIVGPSGSGKSTLARIISGIDPPAEGSARIGGVDVAGQPIHADRDGGRPGRGDHRWQARAWLARRSARRRWAIRGVAGRCPQHRH